MSRCASSGSVDGRRAGGLGEAVGLEDGEAQAVEVAADRRVELRPAGDQQPHAPAQHLVHLAEHGRADVDPHGAQRQVGREQRAEQRAGQPPALVHLAGHALVDQIEELRHAGEDGDPALGQRLEQVGRVQRLEIDDAGTDGERQQQVGHLGQGVEQRQHAEDGVLLAHVHHCERRLAFGRQVAVCQHDALRVGGGPRRVEDDGRVAAGRRARGQLVTSVGRDDRIHRWPRVGVVAVHPHQRHRRRRQGLPRRRQQARAADEESSPRRRQHRLDLRGRVVGVERHGHRADAQHAQIHGAPPRVVVGEDRAPVAAADALRQEPSGDRLGHPQQVAIGDALEAGLALHLDGDVPGEASRRCLEHLPEVRHARIVGQRRRLAAAITAKDPRRHGTSTRNPASRSSVVSCSSVK